MIKVVDIFAGPGGLSEGFSSVKNIKGEPVFDVKLSIEKEQYAFETLKLRTFFRQFPDGAPENYYRFLRREISHETLYQRHIIEAEEAAKRCWNFTLGSDENVVTQVREKVDNAILQDDAWVLIGGPPCQAYSLAGRSRNKGIEDYNPDTDIRQRLYVEYLQILADHNPALFIMENVKGLLSAKVDNERIFLRILQDLRNPTLALQREGRTNYGTELRGYHIFSLVEKNTFDNGNLKGAVIKTENYGIPQARHRVILLGVRDDIKMKEYRTLDPQPPVSVSQVIRSLPRLRSGLSQTEDSAYAWLECLQSQIYSQWIADNDSDELRILVKKTINELHPLNRGGEFIRAKVSCEYEEDWYCDEKIRGICNHNTRGHIESDLHRYLFAACYAGIHGHSPSLRQFPSSLLPKHTNVETAINSGSHFSDRFRVQIANRPSTTIVSHISRDGHYYIHPDPSQCRSLTVREAARLQTFPDNYFFCGPRTAQYVQVGNAVPPLLAKKIGEIVYEILRDAGKVDG